MSVLLKTKVKNMVSKYGDYEFKLSNININGQKRGCSGFIKNNKTQKIVYISTEKPCYSPLSKLNLVRYAKSMNDYTGEVNQWANDKQLDTFVASLLNR